MLLTTDEFRAFEQTDLADEALQVLLDAAEAEIVRYAGDPSASEEWLVGGYRFIFLDRPTSEITSITETNSSGTVTTLATDDWLLWPGGYRLERLSSGIHPRSTWRGRVVVNSAPENESALRQSVQADLVKLELNTRFGLSQQTIGTWSESYQQSARSTAVQHDLILSRLSHGSRMAIVG